MQTKAQLYCQKNREKLRESARQWYLANRERIKEKRRLVSLAWNRANVERIKHRNKMAHIKDPARRMLIQRRWRMKHPEEAKAMAKKAASKFRTKYPWYDSWQSAKQRCTNPKSPNYERYGAKGITFNLSKGEIAFLWTRDNAARMERPSLDRRDPLKGYTLDNCSFMEISANCRKIAFDNEVKILREMERVSVSQHAPTPDEIPIPVT